MPNHNPPHSFDAEEKLLDFYDQLFQPEPDHQEICSTYQDLLNHQWDDAFIKWRVEVMLQQRNPGQDTLPKAALFRNLLDHCGLNPAAPKTSRSP